MAKCTSEGNLLFRIIGTERIMMCVTANSIITGLYSCWLILLQRYLPLKVSISYIIDDLPLLQDCTRLIIVY